MSTFRVTSQIRENCDYLTLQIQLELFPKVHEICRRHLRSSHDAIQLQIARRRRLVRPECEPTLSNVLNAEYAAEYTSHVDIVDVNVWYELCSDEQFVNQVPGDDVRRAGLVRWKMVERKLLFRQFPFPVPIDTRANVERTHDAARQISVGMVKQVEQVGQIDDHIVVRFEQVANARATFVDDLEPEQRLERHVLVRVGEVALYDVVEASVLFSDEVVQSGISV